MAFVFWRRMSDVERDPALWRRSRREAFFCRADSLPAGCSTAFPQGRERELHSTVGDFVTKHCMKEILGGVIPLHMSLSDFCNLTEKELKTELGIENPEQRKRILTIIQLAKELERESEFLSVISSIQCHTEECAQNLQFEEGNLSIGLCCYTRNLTIEPSNVLVVCSKSSTYITNPKGRRHLAQRTYNLSRLKEEK
ncbi:uncharacterized protein LOC111085019 [Limulus polyphemus]|uniref:Uncharacterized protein LOC111085019 n=1 Tax=Limulus polyphemus TaxID=6850 RepID=A0ABM1S220_LIMPO|nr:uncharacterized protein LOC111085019 [Limulus polyphemus]